MKDLKAGHKIKKSDIGILRTEKILSVGISPEFYQKVLGKKLKVDVKDGEGLLFEHLET
jgi:sialic acid synthase SpsE